MDQTDLELIEILLPKFTGTESMCHYAWLESFISFHFNSFKFKGHQDGSMGKNACSTGFDLIPRIHIKTEGENRLHRVVF